MPSPFPGMDPYLEDPEIWSGVHAGLLAAICEQLGPVLRPKYVVRYEERVYVTSEEDLGYRMIVPDLRVVERDPLASVGHLPGASTISVPIKVELAEPEIHEASLVVRDVRDRSVATVIEVLSPTNKVLNSHGRESFLKKRREVMSGTASWVEIDLLRDGARTANLPRVPPSEYQVYLSRSGHRRQAEVWAISLRKPLPVIAIPLHKEDPDVPLNLQIMLATVIDRGSYDLDTEYDRDAVPPLAPTDTQWSKQVISEWRERKSD
jgi:hypothetical protein